VMGIRDIRQTSYDTPRSKSFCVLRSWHGNDPCQKHHPGDILWILARCYRQHLYLPLKELKILPVMLTPERLLLAMSDDHTSTLVQYPHQDCEFEFSLSVAIVPRDSCGHGILATGSVRSLLCTKWTLILMRSIAVGHVRQEC